MQLSYKIENMHKIKLHFFSYSEMTQTLKNKIQLNVGARESSQ